VQETIEEITDIPNTGPFPADTRNGEEDTYGDSPSRQGV
jgi:hypothetical protein